MVKVALAAGHHNRDGGNPVEHAIVGELVEAEAREMRRLGLDVRVITPDGMDADADPGDGEFSGGLQDVARRVVTWYREGWTADLFLEAHTEGVADTAVRGAFGVYPDWGSDLDADAAELGRVCARAIRQATGIPLRGTGAMPESQTYVGSQGSRLGAFAATIEVKGTTTRLILEHGSHSNPTDLAILQSPTGRDKIAKAVAGAVATYFKVPVIAAPPATADEVRTYPQTGKRVGHGFLKFFDANGGIDIFGLPITDERQEMGTTVQYFERARFEHRPRQGVRGGDVALGLVGAEALAWRS